MGWCWIGSTGGPDGGMKAILYCRCCDSTAVVRDRDLHQRTKATTRTTARRATEIQIKMDTVLGLDRCSTISCLKTSSAMVWFLLSFRCCLMRISWVSMCLVPSSSLAELGSVAGLKSHSKWMASGAILRVKSEWMEWFVSWTEQPWGMEMRDVVFIFRGK